jgi:hypothetical protein
MLPMELGRAAWDPVSALSDDDRSIFQDCWAELGEVNVPGPFYTGMTDNCWTGRLHAPDNVVYAGEYFNEYVFRQPRDAGEVAALTEAAEADPFRAYGCHGDDHWTPVAVRAWWHNRQRVIDVVSATLESLAGEERSDSLDAAQGLRDFLSYIDDGLATDLRAYIFRLEAGRFPLPDDPLPEL